MLLYNLVWCLYFLRWVIICKGLEETEQVLKEKITCYEETSALLKYVNKKNNKDR